MSGTRCRLTVGQALVRWLQAQWSERDGVRRRAVPAMWGIFGHGNVLGLGQAVAAGGRTSCRCYQPKHEQAMVHAALGFAKAARRLQVHACTASIGPGAANLLTGAATATVNRLPVLLLPADTFATRRSGVVLQQLERPARRRCHRQRRVPPAQPLLRPRRPARAAAHGAPGRDAGAARPGRDGRGDRRAAPGRAGRGVRLAARVLRPADVAGQPPSAGRGGAGGGAGRCSPPPSGRC